jgi:hypothetical protein
MADYRCDPAIGDLPRLHLAAGYVATNRRRPLNLTMAKRNYLVEGLSGVGKSSVYEELIRRGYTAISTDRAWAYNADPDTGLPGGPVGHDTWVWDQRVAVRELESPEPEAVVRLWEQPQQRPLPALLTKVFSLRIDDDTMRRRLEGRTDDDWPLGDEGVELMLDLNRRAERLAGAIDVDASGLSTRSSTSCFAWQIWTAASGPRFSRGGPRDGTAITSHTGDHRHVAVNRASSGSIGHPLSLARLAEHGPHAARCPRSRPDRRLRLRGDARRVPPNVNTDRA